MDPEQRARILSVYLRPWVLHVADAPTHVPHLANLDVVVSEALALQRKRARRHTKTPNATRNRVGSCDDHRTKHVVSHHAAKTTRNLLLTQMAESVEADEFDGSAPVGRSWQPVDTSWVSVDTAQQVLQPHAQRESAATGQKLQFEPRVDQATELSARLWNCDHRPTAARCKDGAIVLENTAIQSTARAQKVARDSEARAALIYGGVSQRAATRWLAKLS